MHPFVSKFLSSAALLATMAGGSQSQATSATFTLNAPPKDSGYSKSFREIRRRRRKGGGTGGAGVLRRKQFLTRPPLNYWHQRTPMEHMHSAARMREEMKQAKAV